ncbi:MAG: hypothetical protein FWD76_03775 [Firmicutes bacterium]|nr:hypothetical protein [Bacillota bacterium]
MRKSHCDIIMESIEAFILDKCNDNDITQNLLTKKFIQDCIKDYWAWYEQFMFRLMDNDLNDEYREQIFKDVIKQRSGNE